jgi:hypothetical protein
VLQETVLNQSNHAFISGFQINKPEMVRPFSPSATLFRQAAHAPTGIPCDSLRGTICGFNYESRGDGVY